ncbi:probable N-acetyltransferase camello isoform X4 [Dendrobates tinctorius]|uniref:probable N-acetyltransferase camello isoform X4 n=1 Tax=Dendrobates tinctorius TaxID=92724 RepID=UPI003CCA4EEB
MTSIPGAGSNGAQPGGEEAEMLEYKIRSYQDSDYEAVRDLFSHGMSDSKSFIFPVLAVTLLLAVGRHVIGYCWSLYIDHCLKEDLQDIQKTYMEAQGSHFWVAEVEDRVIGTVAAKPSDEIREELQLKRMSVRKDFRGFGIAKAMSREVIGFARQRGYRAVVLNTLMIQHEAQRMYESVGFRKSMEFVLPTVYGQLVNFTISKYRYDVLQSK